MLYVVILIIGFNINLFNVEVSVGKWFADYKFWGVILLTASMPILATALGLRIKGERVNS